MAQSTYPGLNVSVADSYYSFSSPADQRIQLVIDRVDRHCGEIRLETGILPRPTRQFSAAALLGTIHSPNNQYIILALTSVEVGKIAGHSVHRVKATDILPVSATPYESHDSFLNLLKDHLKTAPLYFSRTLDITNSFQRQVQANSSSPLWERADDRFFWNRFAQDDLIKYRNRSSSNTAAILDKFIQPVMFGMMEIRNTAVQNHPFTYVLITRRSRHRAGTRYFSRGIDEQGNVSNFNETEQVILLDGTRGQTLDLSAGLATGISAEVPDPGSDLQILSYVQTRGSVPVYWQEINTLKYLPKLEVRDVTLAAVSARQHFEEQIRIYGTNYLVNLVNYKGREERVKAGYERIVDLLTSKPDPLDLHYIYFDFHNETKGLRWDRAKLLLDKLKTSIVENGYFHCSVAPGQQVRVHRRQTATIRTNCMDCLDRTNVVQSMFAHFMLDLMLVDTNILSKETIETAKDPKFEALFRNVWADNADVVSKAYSGTGALKTDFTRTGNRTKVGMVQDFSNSCTRYVKNNLFDGPRQDAFDLFLGAFRPMSYYPTDSSHVLSDRRPLIIRAIPYLLVASVFFVFVGMLTRRDPSAAVWPLRLMILLAATMGVMCVQFIMSNGELYVNWPRLNKQRWIEEHERAALVKALQNPVTGPLIEWEDKKMGGGKVGPYSRGHVSTLSGWKHAKQAV